MSEYLRTSFQCLINKSYVTIDEGLLFSGLLVVAQLEVCNNSVANLLRSLNEHVVASGIFHLILVVNVIVLSTSASQVEASTRQGIIVRCVGDEDASLTLLVSVDLH